MNELDFEEYERIPFQIHATKVTRANIDMVASLTGELVRATEDSDPYIVVDKKLVFGISRIHIGYWLTKTDDGQYRGYRPEVFGRQFRLTEVKRPSANPYTMPQTPET